jgi:hypothetical protein
MRSNVATLVLQILELADVCGGCDTVCMLSNIMCYCTDDATADFFTALLSPVSNDHTRHIHARLLSFELRDTVC